MINLETYTQGAVEVGYVRTGGLKKPESDPMSESVDITTYVNYFEIHSSLDMSFRVGILSIFDSFSFREQVGFVGNDIVSISYTSVELAGTTNASEKKQATFRIVNIEEVVDSGTDPSQALTKRRVLNLTLAEFPLFDYFIGNQIYKTYEWGSGSATESPQGTQTISDIIKNLLSEEVSPGLLSGWGYETDIQQTSEISNPSKQWNFYVPRWTLMKTVSFLKKFAVSQVGKYPGYIFTSRDIVNQKIITFKSIYSIINDIGASQAVSQYTPRYTLQKTIANNPSAVKNSNPQWIANAILSFKYDVYNGFDVSFGGLSGKTYMTNDYFSGIKAEAYSFNQFKLDNKNGLDSYFIYQNDFGDQWSNMFYSSHEKYHVDMVINDYAKKVMGSVRCLAQCHLNPFRYIGQHARLAINSTDINNGDGQIDSINNGNWITWSIIDYYNKDGTSFSEVEFRKDSLHVNSIASRGLETAGG